MDNFAGVIYPAVLTSSAVDRNFLLHAFAVLNDITPITSASLVTPFGPNYTSNFNNINETNPYEVSGSGLWDFNWQGVLNKGVVNGLLNFTEEDFADDLNELINTSSVNTVSIIESFENQTLTLRGLTSTDSSVGISLTEGGCIDLTTSGSVGTQGTTGETGPQGETGSTGATGATGPQGAAGPSNVLNTSNSETNNTFYPVFVAGTGNQTPLIRSSSDAFSVNPFTGNLTLGGSQGRLFPKTGSESQPAITWVGAGPTTNGIYFGSGKSALYLSVDEGSQFELANNTTTIGNQLVTSNQNKVSTSNRTNTSGTQNFNAETDGIGRWVASLVGNITGQISNLTDGRSFFLYVANDTTTSHTLTIQASTTTSSYSNVTLSNSGGDGRSVITLAPTIKGALAVVTIWVSNVNGNFIGAAY